MKFYTGEMPPNPRRVNQFLQYKGIGLDTQYIDMMKNEQFTDEYKAVNPATTIPCLQLDDGTVLTEVVGICLYLEHEFPEKPLMGAPGKEQALVVSAMHHIFVAGLLSVAEVLRNTLDVFKGRALPGPLDVEQIPELAERGVLKLNHFYQAMDSRLEGQEYLVGAKLTQADIDLRVVCDFAAVIQQKVPTACANLAAHQQRISEQIPV